MPIDLPRSPASLKTRDVTTKRRSSMVRRSRTVRKMPSYANICSSLQNAGKKRSSVRQKRQTRLLALTSLVRRSQAFSRFRKR